MAMSCSARPTGHFTLWQLPSVADDHGNSYVIRTSNDSIIVIDGGKTPEAEYLRGFLAALGNKVSAWFFTHPHNDHVFAARKILSNRQGLRVGHIYHSRFTDEMVEKGERHWQAKAWNATVDSITDIPVTDMHAGDTLMIDGVLIRILSEKNPEIYDNQYNNSSMAFRVEDDSKSVVFLGDLGVEGGNKLLNSPYRKYLDCDYLQVAHHGQNGCTEEFYKSIKFTACLWPTATWVWNNDIGGGFNTGPLTTITTRRWMDEIGIKKHYVSIDGLQRID
jgi:beta-lactamase superfamily II metal-dependent hydrolase